MGTHTKSDTHTDTPINTHTQTFSYEGRGRWSRRLNASPSSLHLLCDGIVASRSLQLKTGMGGERGKMERKRKKTKNNLSWYFAVGCRELERWGCVYCGMEAVVQLHFFL